MYIYKYGWYVYMYVKCSKCFGLALQSSLYSANHSAEMVLKSGYGFGFIAACLPCLLGLLLCKHSICMYG